MYSDIISASYKGGYKIELTFENGRSGAADFTKYIERGGVFDRLTDQEFFKRFRVNKELGVLTWNDEIDIAPEVLYSEATGEPLPDWMQKESRTRETP
jgi:hypothetical protein